MGRADAPAAGPERAGCQRREERGWRGNLLLLLGMLQWDPMGSLGVKHGVLRLQQQRQMWLGRRVVATVHGETILNHSRNIRIHGGNILNHSGNIHIHGGNIHIHGGSILIHGGNILNHGGNILNHSGNIPEGAGADRGDLGAGKGPIWGERGA